MLIRWLVTSRQICQLLAISALFSTSYPLISVVYFSQHLGAARTENWSKYFLSISRLKVRKKENLSYYCYLTFLSEKSVLVYRVVAEWFKMGQTPLLLTVVLLRALIQSGKLHSVCIIPNVLFGRSRKVGPNRLDRPTDPTNTHKKICSGSVNQLVGQSVALILAELATPRNSDS